MWRPIKWLDSLVDGISMYRLLLYYLLALVVGAAILSQAGVLHYKASTVLISAAVTTLTCYVINKVFAYFFDAPTNYESALLTGLILALIIPPFSSLSSFSFLIAASALAMASKYLLAIRERHIFNPAAIALVLTAYGPHQYASWWVGTAALLPFVLIGGVLIMRKLRIEAMVLTFFGASLVGGALYAALSHVSVTTNLRDIIFSSAMFYLGFVMLSEPSTAPSTRTKQMLYGGLVGLLLPPQVHIGRIYTSPENALVVGNLFAYLVSSKTKLLPRLIERVQVTAASFDFIFKPNRQMAYQPGQYMVWTLPHSKTDARGNRRYFSLASSPTEPTIRIGVKFYPKGSSFKKALMGISRDSQVSAGELGGDFTLPKDKSKKLVFIAGGIGITPYRSMLKYLIDSGEKRDICLLYAVKAQSEIAYRGVLNEARQRLGLKLAYFVEAKNDHGEDVIGGRLSAAWIKEALPDFGERWFYLSGPQPMVADLKHQLRSIGVKRRHIKTDYFSGYA